MELITHGEVSYEILQLDSGRYKWVLHGEDGEIVAWGHAINSTDARRLLADAFFAHVTA